MSDYQIAKLRGASIALETAAKALRENRNDLGFIDGMEYQYSVFVMLQDALENLRDEYMRAHRKADDERGE